MADTAVDTTTTTEVTAKVSYLKNRCIWEKWVCMEIKTEKKARILGVLSAANVVLNEKMLN